MLEPMLCLRTILLLTFLTTFCFAQAPPDLPIEVQRQGENFFFVSQPDLSGFRVALYDRNGGLIAQSVALTDHPLRWPVLTAKGTSMEPGVYLCVLWLRGQSSAVKRLARLEVQSNALILQSGEAYLAEVEPPNSVFWGTPEYRDAERRAYERGIEAIPFFRLATKVLPDESAAYLFLVQAIQTKYARFGMNLLAQPPPPPPPPPPVEILGRTARKQRAKPPLREKQRAPKQSELDTQSPREPTAEEKQEMLSAGQKAVAVAKTCLEKSNALQWLASIQAELALQEEQFLTLEQIARSSCATNEIKALSWYNIGVTGWHCSYQMTTHYAKTNRLASEPFHYRKIANAADQRRVSHCLLKATDAIEKALSLKPDYAEAWSYRSLLYREQQKTTSSPAERRKLEDAAEQAAKRALELTRKQQQQ